MREIGIISKRSYRQVVGVLLVGLAILVLIPMFVIVELVVAGDDQALMESGTESGQGAGRLLTPVPVQINYLTPTPLPLSLIEVPVIEVSEDESQETLLPAPTPTVVHLDLGADFTPVTPLVGWPVGGQMTQGFGCSPYYTGVTGPGCPDDAPWFHDGVDIAGPEGAPVRAAMTGTVIFAAPDGSGPACGDFRGYGLSVIVDNGVEWQALYAHLSRIDVTVGQAVLPETLVGAVGQTGCATGSHLHFGLRYQDTLVDPALSFDKPSNKRITTRP